MRLWRTPVTSWRRVVAANFLPVSKQDESERIQRRQLPRRQLVFVWRPLAAFNLLPAVELARQRSAWSCRAPATRAPNDKQRERNGARMTRDAMEIYGTTALELELEFGPESGFESGRPSGANAKSNTASAQRPRRRRASSTRPLFDRRRTKGAFTNHNDDDGDHYYCST